MIEADSARAREVADLLPQARVLHATGIEPDFLERERIGSRAGRRSSRCETTRRTTTRPRSPSCTASNSRSRSRTRRPPSRSSSGSGIDVAINPRRLTAEEIVRFAHDPRTQQVAMFEGDRSRSLDIVVREEQPVRRQAVPRAADDRRVIGAIVRDGKAIFPHGDDALRPGDRVIIFTESERVHEVERRFERSGARCGGRSPLPRRRRLSAALNLVGHAAQVPQPRRPSCRLIVAVGYGEPFWPSWLAGAIAAGGRARARAGDARAPTRSASREGFLVVSSTWLLAAGLGALPYLFSGEEQLGRARSTRTSRRCRASRRRARASLTDIAALDRSLALWRQFTQWLGGHGHHRARSSPCSRACASAADRCSSPSCPGPRSSRWRRTIRDTARRLWLLYVGPHRRRDRCTPGASA